MADDLALGLGEASDGRIPSRVLVARSLAAYDRTESLIHAFAWLDRHRAISLAEAWDRGGRSGALPGIPIGVKDIFDTRGIPTERGSRLFAGRVPTESAAVVKRLEAAGAIVLGKTVTTELAYYEPGPTRNPWRPSRTPGGSSQGSAAAVAAGVVAGAIGSQTNGSVIRPAAYCGVVGYKPSRGLVSTRGCMTLSRTLDHVGLFTRTVRDAWLLASVIGVPLGPRPVTVAPKRLLVVRTADWDAAEPDMRARFETVVERLEQTGVPVDARELPALDRASELVALFMACESARGVGREALAAPALVGARALELFRQGLAMERSAYDAAVQERRRLIAAFDRAVGPDETILTLATSGEAPGLETTGDPRFCSRWTLVGAPAMTIPVGVGRSGLPLGIQLVGARGRDEHLLSVAGWLASAVG